MNTTRVKTIHSKNYIYGKAMTKLWNVEVWSRRWLCRNYTFQKLYMLPYNYIILHLLAVWPISTSWECLTYSTKIRFQDAIIVMKWGQVWNGRLSAIKLNKQVGFPKIQAHVKLIFLSFAMHVESNFLLLN